MKERKQFDIDIKKNIAEKAIALLAPGITIFLDISTSNIELAKLIIDSCMNLTVVSNMLEVVQLFCVDTAADFISTGGRFNNTHDGFDGSFCVQSIARFKFDMSFIGNVGIDVDNNKIYTYAHEDGRTDQGYSDWDQQIWRPISRGWTTNATAPALLTYEMSAHG